MTDIARRVAEASLSREQLFTEIERLRTLGGEAWVAGFVWGAMGGLLFGVLLCRLVVR